MLPEVVDELILLQQLITKDRRRDLGTKLGIHRNELKRIEKEALRMSTKLQQRRAVLEEMVSYAFKKDSLRKLPNALAELRPNPTQAEVIAIRDLVAFVTGIIVF